MENRSDWLPRVLLLVLVACGLAAMHTIGHATHTPVALPTGHPTTFNNTVDESSGSERTRTFDDAASSYHGFDPTAIISSDGACRFSGGSEQARSVPSEVSSGTPHRSEHERSVDDRASRSSHGHAVSAVAGGAVAPSVGFDVNTAAEVPTGPVSHAGPAAVDHGSSESDGHGVGALFMCLAVLVAALTAVLSRPQRALGPSVAASASMRPASVEGHSPVRSARRAVVLRI